MKKTFLGQAWLILLLAVCFGGLLAGVQVAWGPKIEANKEDDARSQIPDIVPGARAELTPPAADVEARDPQGGRQAYRVYRAMGPGEPDAVQLGWVVKAKGAGYADTIEVLIGLDLRAERITGLAVLAQNETPGLGSKIAKPKWRGQFAGKSTQRPLEAVKKGQVAADHHIQAVSGATISSESVCKIVNRALADLAGRLRSGRIEDSAKASE
ncbi:MAG TPA: FMN-binding protein [Phycisphaerae bacterium]|nr:FMN-binding protein [Phycisphaerae bacterium]HUT58840.1 FMN-binding protein [Phycisphaerae bacterium]